MLMYLLASVVWISLGLMFLEAQSIFLLPRAAMTVEMMHLQDKVT
jgi:hypothetical protein